MVDYSQGLSVIFVKRRLYHEQLIDCNEWCNMVPLVDNMKVKKCIAIYHE